MGSQCCSLSSAFNDIAQKNANNPLPFQKKPRKPKCHFYNDTFEFACPSQRQQHGKWCKVAAQLAVAPTAEGTGGLSGGGNHHPHKPHTAQSHGQEEGSAPVSEHNLLVAGQTQHGFSLSFVPFIFLYNERNNRIRWSYLRIPVAERGHSTVRSS